MAQPIRSDAARPSVPPQSPLVEDGNVPASAQAHEHLTDDEHGHDHAFDWQDGTRIAAVAVAAALVWFRVWEPFARVSVIGLVGTLIGIYPIFKEAVENISERRMTMELSMTIAILAALVIGQFFTALVIVLFVLIAEVLEDLTVRRGRTAIKDLLNLLPREVTVRRNGKPETISTDNIQVGEIIEVRPGGRIPVDGLVVSGNSFVDQSTITGESLPAEKLPGTSVYAGTVNHSGALEIRVVGVGRDTAFGRILNAVEEAERSRAPILGANRLRSKNQSRRVKRQFCDLIDRDADDLHVRRVSISDRDSSRIGVRKQS